MLAILMLGADEIGAEIARRARALRLSRRLTQDELAASAGVSLGSLKRFERSGKISLESLIRLALVLDATAELDTWFVAPPPASLDELLARDKPRQRGRRA